ncbi:ABC transporter substrate-binding protein [Desulfuribacillus alkaliarsenatis]|uniref:Fe/B12 periplasmic-binding domain-containing protein n=1 Tax=Desulfuribacillus alkaliarsenatis TaxID=766136 RepID=A0A1E5G4K7_9FIRM|nr:ABC transporter substrate-binding protein [Desulfuribacillus alkaliarsenatis]OEF98122.1 hypothetical protein BHF68_00060 [Desulfuribacillus alkaliarsenatis]
MQLEYYSLHKSKFSLPDEPRVVSLMPHITDHLLSLKIVPVGTVKVNDYETEFHGYLKKYLTNSMVIGSSIELNLEAIASLKPDIIIGEGKKHLFYLNKLSSIAPTFLFKDLTVDWQLVFKIIGNMFGRQSVVAKELELFKQKINDIKNFKNKTLFSKNILFANHWKRNLFRVYSHKSHLGKILYEEIQLPYAGYDYESIEKPLITLSINDIMQTSVDELFILTDTANPQRIHIQQYFDHDKQKHPPQIHYLPGLKDGIEGKGLILYNQIIQHLFHAISSESKEVQKIV